MIELLDHTADVGFEPGASTHNELVDEALLKAFFEPPPGEHSEIFVRAGGGLRATGRSRRHARTPPTPSRRRTGSRA